MKLLGIGGANTKTGLVFEGKTDLATFLKSQTGYDVQSDGTVVYLNEIVGRIFKKNGLYKFLDELGIEWRTLISKKLLPDDSIFVIINHTLFIIECKFQQVAGSVDEKLQTCDLKRNNIGNYFHALTSKLNTSIYSAIGSSTRVIKMFWTITTILSMFRSRN